MSQFDARRMQRMLAAPVLVLVGREPSQRNRLQRACEAAHSEFLSDEFLPPEPSRPGALRRLLLTFAKYSGSRGTMDPDAALRMTDEEVDQCALDLVELYVWTLSQ
ncbi:MAG: hypothetical protein IPJ41_16865 [Phycisphaerales bacterium]|nr:hypothetical protein [Phycisphaerales bacterium]